MKIPWLCAMMLTYTWAFSPDAQPSLARHSWAFQPKSLEQKKEKTEKPSVSSVDSSWYSTATDEIVALEESSPARVISCDPIFPWAEDAASAAYFVEISARAAAERTTTTTSPPHAPEKAAPSMGFHAPRQTRPHREIHCDPIPWGLSGRARTTPRPPRTSAPKESRPRTVSYYYSDQTTSPMSDLIDWSKAGGSPPETAVPVSFYPNPDPLVSSADGHPIDLWIEEQMLASWSNYLEDMTAPEAVGTPSDATKTPDTGSMLQFNRPTTGSERLARMDTNEKSEFSHSKHAGEVIDVEFVNEQDGALKP